MLAKRNRKVRLWAYHVEPLSINDPTEIEVTATPSSTVSVEMSPPGTVTEPEKKADSTKLDWTTVIPEDLRDKEHFKNILKAENPGLELVKQLDNAQSLIGKRPAGIPADDASDEDWNKFYETTRPKEAAEYEIPPIELGDDLKEYAAKIKELHTDDTLNEAKAIFHKHGLTKKQAKGIAADWEMKQAKDLKGFVEAAKVHEQKEVEFFETTTQKSFGGDKEKMLALGQKFMKEFTTDAQREVLKTLPESKMPTEACVVVAMLAKAVYDKYEKEDKFEPGKVDSQKGSVDDVTAEMRALQASPAYTDPFAADHETVRGKVTALAKRKAELLKKQ